ncbi:hypothetical protein N0V90_004712 [Kalmusia sp. IMI 367209]|nr:hypothetical protein N0V90_004712 [Kalmusia sp. IMI 367209]
MAVSSAPRLLPPDLVEHQIAQIDLLMAMYSEEEIKLERTSEQLLSLLKASCGSESISRTTFCSIPTVTLLLTLTVSESHPLQLDLNVPFSYQGSEAPEGAPRTKIRIRQPSWMNKAATAQLSSQILEQEDLFSTIEFINQAAADYLSQAQSQQNEQANSSSMSSTGPIVRVWFYFPSISTRSKRDDFIIHAPTYSLTGFLFAGKPGLLCLEGTSQNIDSYMKFIKTESWGDIPAHHKKVSERHREEKVERVFENMQEITDDVGERRGARANRGDMKAVEGWLGVRGLGDAFAKVLM